MSDAALHPVLDRMRAALSAADPESDSVRRAAFERALLDVRVERGERATAPGIDDARLSGEDAPPGAVARARALVSDLEGDDALDALEAAFAEVPISPTLRSFFGEVKPESVADSVRERAWAMAGSATRLEAVKWGIVLGTLRPGPHHVDDLVAFARHPELARYALPPLVHIGSVDADVADRVYALLPETSGYAAVYLIQHLLTEPTWRARPSFAPDVLGHAMRYGLKAVVAVPMASSLPLETVWERSRVDDSVFESVVMLMGALIYDSAGYPDEARSAAIERVYRSYVTLLRGRPMDVRVASALQTLTEFLDDHEASVGVQDREWRREEVERLLTPGVEEDELRRALRDPAERSLALHVIEGRKLFALFPALVEMGVEALDPHAVHVLARYGGTPELEFLSLALPRVADLAARTGPIQTSSDVHENRDEDRLVAEITAAMGRHGTDIAIGHLKRGATDPHPWVRAAACDGMANLPPERWDDEMRALVLERLDDAPEYVAEEARRAALAAGLDTAR